MDKRTRAVKIVRLLEAEYPLAVCSINYDEAWKLLFSTRLSAQCTDKRVNMVTPLLFKRYPTIEALAAADSSELEDIIRPCGLYKTKARDLKYGALYIIERYDGLIPDDMDKLLKIPGIGRKTANLVLGDVFGKPAIVADTHCIRLAGRLELCASSDPYKVELALSELVPAEDQSVFCHRCVYHGRAVCSARSPHCGACCIADLCPRVGVDPSVSQALHSHA